MSEEIKKHLTMHIVKYGETLRGICELYGVDLEKIKSYGINQDVLKRVKVSGNQDIADVIKAFQILKKEMNDKLDYLSVGMEVEL